MSNKNSPTTAGSPRRAFTLIELLVVIGIIALLIGLLLPSMGKARDVARTVVCSATQRGLGQAQQFYLSENKEFFASMYTSGAEQHAAGSNLTPFYGDTSATTPVQRWDWISPIIGNERNFQPNRAARFAQILNDNACAANRNFNQNLFGDFADKPEFENYQLRGQAGRTQGYRMVSYLQPIGFGTFSPRASNAIRAYKRRDGTTFIRDDSSSANFANPAASPDNYMPRLDLVGTQLSNKVLLMDGMRFFEYTNTSIAGSNQGDLDFDATVPGGTYGAFYDSPAFERGHSYGSRRDLASGASRAPAGATAHIRLTFRHNDGVNATFFDGSTRYLKRKDVWERVDYFHPSNSIYTGADVHADARNSGRFQPQTRLP
jgi:prepilin-type N-terminal cleavage/methylation domain-containing protein/prepilin-type processing-associated H-X9-DG protein